MKQFKFIKPGLLMFLLLVILTSCKQDEVSYEGNLRVKFINRPLDLTITVFSIDNSDIPIYSNNIQLNSEGIFEKKLNVGNYFISPYSTSAVFFPKAGFQIKSDQTTTIAYDLNNIPQQQ